MTADRSEQGAINRYYLTLSSYNIDPRYLDEGRVQLGSGVDLSDPLRPLVSQRTAFVPIMKSGAEEPGLIKSSDVIEETAVLRESLTEQEEAHILSTNFKTSYGLSNLQAAFETAKKQQSSFHTIYALLEHSGEAEHIPERQLCWCESGAPVSESIPDRDQALLQFIQTYGSHYVSAMKYGLRIAIQGKIRKTGTETNTAFSAAFKATFGSFGADGGVKKEDKEKLQSMSVDLVLEATSGGHSGPGLLVINGFDDIMKFLNDIKNDKVRFKLAPIELTLKPYWPLLDPKWVNTRAALNPLTASFRTPGAPYGVPKGTVVAWWPTSDFIENLQVPPESRHIKIVPPSGWAICDGTNGTPDLRNRFIRGIADWNPVVQIGGAEEHGHGGATKLNTGKRDAHGGAGGKYWQPSEEHDHVIKSDTHLPPYADLVYIMKLADIP